MDKTVRGRARMERGNTHSGTTKKSEISRTLLSINLHFSVHLNAPPYLCGEQGEKLHAYLNESFLPFRGKFQPGKEEYAFQLSLTVGGGNEGGGMGPKE